MEALQRGSGRPLSREPTCFWGAIGLALNIMPIIFSALLTFTHGDVDAVLLLENYGYKKCEELWIQEKLIEINTRSCDI